ncbi:MAG: pyridoxal 5'-phosphate synthase glutaminase subunit PdxT [Prevotella sp.]|nr:pyridoxal 5'-phosphate synthase glutaminase subunit PdxT [Prevotella sp.]
MKRIAVMALQGAFIEHERRLQALGAETFEVRQLADWNQPKDGLVLPGGESTTQLKLLTDLGLLEPVRRDILAGLPVFGTCAGLILLAKDVEGEPYPRLSTMDIRVRRNAYGRQLGSFATEHEMEGVGRIPMTFIRAPYIESVSGDARVLAEVDGHIVAAQQGNQLVTAFHPELNDDPAVHRYFLSLLPPSNPSTPSTPSTPSFSPSL